MTGRVEFGHRPKERLEIPRPRPALGGPVRVFNFSRWSIKCRGRIFQRKGLVKIKVGSPLEPEELAPKRTQLTNTPSPQPGSRHGNSGGAALKSKVLRAGKMPSLPRDDIKIVIRPRGGLIISKIGAATVAEAILAAAGISQEDLHRERVPSFVVHRGCSSQRTPPLRGHGRQNGPIHGDAPLLSLAPAPGRGTTHRGWTRWCSRTPTTPMSKKKPTLSWANKAREGRESPRGDDSPRCSPRAKELDELRRPNEQLRKENAQVKQEMSRLTAEMAEIRRLASSPPSAQPASSPVAMDTSEAPHRSSAPKRQAVENTEKEETGNLLSELKDAFVNMQATLAKIQEAMTHPEMGLGALSEPSQVG
ncbi:hypothetical protein HPB50_028830 [Hyalomma asiaticum]|nr:hypothetical protein HPB50_028830 [Hyalomma asiaticum]